MNLLNEESDSNFVTRKWNIVNDQSNANYDVGNEIIYNKKVLKSNLCDYNNACNLVRGDFTIIGDNGTQVAFKNCTPFIKCIKKIHGTTINDAKHLDLVMPMYNLLKNSSNYSDTRGILWFYSKDKANNFNANIAKTNAFKSFEYEDKLLGDTVAQPAPNNNNDF